jgi:hypothetical protein
MSYSFRVHSTLDADGGPVIDEQIEALPDGPGKDEAAACRDTIVAVVGGLAAAKDFAAFDATVSGHGSDSELNLSVLVKAVADAASASEGAETSTG